MAVSSESLKKQYVRRGWGPSLISADNTSLLSTLLSNDETESEREVIDNNIGLAVGKSSKVIAIVVDPIERSPVTSRLKFYPISFSCNSFETMRIKYGMRSYVLFSLTHESSFIQNGSKYLFEYEGAQYEWTIRSTGGHIVLPPSVMNAIDEVEGYHFDQGSGPRSSLFPFPDDLAGMLFKLEAVQKKSYGKMRPLRRREANALSELLRLLKGKRASNETSFLDIGLALHSQGNHFVSCWLVFSYENDLIHRTSTLLRTWASFDSSKSDVDIDYIHSLARKDNPDGYNRWVQGHRTYDPSSPYSFYECMRNIKRRVFTAESEEDVISLAKKEIIPLLFRVIRYDPIDNNFIIKKSTSRPFEKRNRISFNEKSVSIKLKISGKRTGADSYSLNVLDVISELEEFQVNELINVPYSPIELDPVAIATTCGQFNTFMDYKAKLVKKVNFDLISPLLNHIAQVWADDNLDYYRYMIFWFSQIIINPRERSGIALVLIGEEGCGKTGILSFFIECLLGYENCYETVGLNKIAGKFNASASKMFIMISELGKLDRNGKYAYMFNYTRALISDRRVGIEAKYRDSEVVNNYANIVISSSGISPLMLSPSDRRYAIFKCSSRYVGNERYFKRLCNGLNQEVADHFLTFLVNFHFDHQFDISLQSIPDTDIRRFAKEANVDSVQLFFYDLFQRSYNLETELLISANNETYLTANQFYQEYLTWLCAESECTINSFSQRASQYCQQYGNKIVHKKGKYKDEFGESGHITVYIFLDDNVVTVAAEMDYEKGDLS